MIAYIISKISFKVFFLILFLLKIDIAFAQTSQVVSDLERRLAIEKKPQQKASLLIEIAFELGEAYPKKGINYAQQALKLSQTNKLSDTEALANYAIAACLRFLNEHRKALEFIQKAREMFLNQKNIVQQNKTLRDIGILYSNLHQYNIADSCLKITTSYFQNKQNLQEDYALSLNYLGVNTLRQNNFKLATEYFQNALYIFQNIKSIKMQGRMQNNIGLAYKNMGYFRLGLEHYLKALDLYEKMPEKYKGQITTMINIGNMYYHIADSTNYPNAKKYLLKSLELSIATKDTISQINALDALANMEGKYNNISKLEYYYKQAIELLKKINTLEDLPNINRRMSYAYFRAGEIQKAITIQKYILTIYDNTKDFYPLAITHLDLAKMYQTKKINDSAKINLEKATSYFKKATVVKMSSYYYQTSINIYQQEGNYQRCKEDALKMLENAIASHVKLDEAIAYKLIAVADSSLQNYASAIQYYFKYENLDDSLKKEENRKQLFEIQRIYDLDAEEKRNVILRKKNELQTTKIAQTRLIGIIIFILFVMTLIAVYTLFKSNKSYQIYGKELQKKQDKIVKQSVEVLQQKEKLQIMADGLKAKNEIISIQNKKLTEINEVRTKLITIIAHDLRRPFANLTGVVNMLKDSDLTIEEQQETFKKLDQQIVNTHEFMNQLLTWAKSQLEGFKFRPITFDINILLGSIIDLFSSQTQEKGITIENKLPYATYIFADIELLRIVFINLLSNAIKFTNENGKISFSAQERNKETIIIKVTDNGVGISQKNQEKYNKGESFTTLGTSNESGFGFGLTLCKGLAEVNKSTLLVESVPNEGTTFSIILPRDLVNF